MCAFSFHLAAVVVDRPTADGRGAVTVLRLGVKSTLLPNCDDAVRLPSHITAVAQSTSTDIKVMTGTATLSTHRHRYCRHEASLDVQSVAH
jgi:hypothetical protein